MFSADTHLHTHHSEDSSAEPMQMAIRAAEIGLRGICFTDHWDPGDPDVGRHLDIDRYVEDILAIRKQMRGRLEIRLGIEVGVQPHMMEHINRTLASYPFEYVIASLHCISGVSVGIRPEALFSRKDPASVCADSLRQAVEAIEKFPVFHSYGHADYILRYLPAGPALDERGERCDFISLGLESLVDTLLLRLIESGKALEINTSGFRYGLGRCHPSDTLLERYASLGGRVVTFASDAHCPAHIADNFHQARETAGRFGFRELALF